VLSTQTHRLSVQRSSVNSEMVFHRNQSLYKLHPVIIELVSYVLDLLALEVKAGILSLLFLSSFLD
jgi:hypothetical protein